MEDLQILRHVHDVPIEVAHQVMERAGLVWLFDQRRPRWRQFHLHLALRHFQVSVVPRVACTTQHHEAQLLQDLLEHLQAHPSHFLCVLYRLHSQASGWVCLVPSREDAWLKHILEQAGLKEDLASPAELLL